MKKRRLILLPLLLAAILLMTPGCAVSPMDKIVGQVGPDKITARDVTMFANYMLLNQGYTRSSLTADNIASLNANALEGAISRQVVLQQAAKLGLYPLSAENQQIADYNSTLFESNLQTSGASLEAAGLTEADVKELMTFFEVNHVLLQQATKDVTVTDDEIKAEYDKELASQKASYDADPTAYDSALSGGTTVIVYRPQGYRYIKHILVAMPDAIASQITSATQSGDKSTVATLRKQGLEQIQAKADEVLAQVNGGGDFDALIAQYGQDPGMKAEPAKTAGYQVGAKSSYVPEFLAAAMALGKPGDVSPLVATDYGYHILRYVGDVPAGAVPLADVKEGLRATVLSAKQNDAFTTLLAQWTKDTVIKRNIAKMPK